MRRESERPRSAKDINVKAAVAVSASGDKGGSACRPGLPAASDAKERVPDASKSEEAKAKADDQ